MGIYLDTGALAKLYRAEIGTTTVEQLVGNSLQDCFISRLWVLEMHSVLAQKTRAGEISSADSAIVLQRFRADIRARRFRVAQLEPSHYESAENLVKVYGPVDGLRTLDSLHLAIALDLMRNGLIESIVAADKILCKVASSEGLAAIDPEAGNPQ